MFTSSFHIKEYLSWFASGEQGQDLSLVTPATTASKKVATWLFNIVTNKYWFVYAEDILLFNF